jgi:glycosyltransferase involved in cell wall biosynthesis
MARTNVHIQSSVFQHASRIIKGTRSIVDTGLVDRIIILASYQEGFPREEHLDAERTVIRLPLFFSRFRKNLLTEMFIYVEFLIRSLWVLRRVHVTHVNAHSLSLLPTAVMLRIFKGAKVIYDAHELETERWGLKGVRKFVSKLMERALMPFVSKTIVVGPSIAEWYRNTYPRTPVYVIRNIPLVAAQEQRDPMLLRKSVGLTNDAVILIYQGLFAEGRGIETILKALSETSNSLVHCVFMGDGPLKPMIQQAGESASNVHLIPPVEPEQVLAYSCGADVGLCMIEFCCLSYHYSLPNKFFEYITAGLPLVVYPCPDQVKIVSECKNGWIVDDSTAAVTAFLDRLTQVELRLKKENAAISKKNFDWDTDARQYAEIFQ